MLLSILLIIIGLPILILPLSTDLISNKKITKSGLIFLFFVILFTSLQIINEKRNSTTEEILENKKIDLTKNVDSLKMRTQNLSDSLIIFKKILISIDSQFSNTNSTLFNLRKVNDSLNIKLIESDRPIFHLVKTSIIKSKFFNNQHSIDIIFANEGTRAVTNVYGKQFTLHGDTIFDNGNLQISRTETYPKNQGFTIHTTMRINPDSTSLKEPIYYYFSLNYSDLILKTTYPYVVVMKLIPFSKGNCLDELVFCKDWEVNNVKKIIEKKTLHNK